MHHVFCSPSKIPYVGLSPVRLQTGIQPRPSVGSRRLKRKARIRTPLPALYVPKLPTQKRDAVRSGASAQSDLNLVFQKQSNPEALARRRVLLSRQSHSLVWSSSDSLDPSRRLIFFAQEGLCPTASPGLGREAPQFATHVSFLRAALRTPANRRLLVAIASPLMLVFAFSVEARHPHLHTRRFSLVV